MELFYFVQRKARNCCDLLQGVLSKLKHPEDGLLFFLFSAFLYAKQGFSLTAALPYIPFGLVGAVVGAKLLPKIPQKALQRIFGLLILFSAVRLWMR